MRLTSVVWGVASVPLVYHLGVRLFNRKIGLVSALLLTFSPFHIFYSQDLRPYPLLLFFSLLFFHCSYHALEDNRNIHYIGMIATSVLGIYTHTYMVFPLCIANLYFMFGWKTHRHKLRKWLLSHLATFLLCIPALYFVLQHIQAGNTGLTDFPSGLRSLAGTFYLFTLGRFFFPTPSNLPFIVIQGTIFGTGALTGAFALWRERGSENGRQCLLLFGAAIMTYAIIWFISTSTMPLFDEARVNYLIFFLPLYYFLVAKGWDYLPNPTFQTTVVSLAVVVSLISTAPIYFRWDQVGKGNFRAAAEYVQPNIEKNDIIYHTTVMTTFPFSYYLDWQVPQINLESQYNVNPSSSDHVWLVVFEARGGFSFGLDLLQGRQASTQAEEDHAISICTDYANHDKLRLDEGFQLVDSKVFPGKNLLAVCLYHR